MEIPNSVGNLHGYENSLGNFTRGGGGGGGGGGHAKFSRDFYTGMPNSLGIFVYGDTKFPVWWGIPKTLKGFQNP